MRKYDLALIELLENTTIHGLNHVYTAKFKATKCLWLVMFTLGIAGFSFNLIHIIKRYMSNPILITHFIENEPFYWPDLTFCNPTAPFILEKGQPELYYWQSTMSKSKDSIDILYNSSQIFQILNTFHDDKSELAEKSVMMSTVDPAVLGTQRFEKHVMFYGFSKSHPEVYLTQEYKRYPTDFVHENLRNEISNLFTTQFVQFRNNIPCHTFQIEKSKIFNSSSIHTLFFFINLNYPSYQVFNSSYISRSSIFYVTKKGYLPQDDVTIILPGFTHEVLISQTRFQHEETKNPCRKTAFQVELYDATLSSTYLYEGEYDDCRKVVSQKMYVSKCNCYSPFLPIYKMENNFPKLCFNASIFSAEKMLENAFCMYNVYEKYSKNSTIKGETGVCSKYKAVKCNDYSYKVSSNKEIMVELNSGGLNYRMDQWMKKAYTKLFNRTRVKSNYLQESRENIAFLTVRRASSSGDLYVEKMEYSHSDLISDIGGLMGLWLGLSVVGLFEIGQIVYFTIFKVLFLCFNAICKEEEPHPQDQNIALNEDNL